MVWFLGLPAALAVAAHAAEQAAQEELFLSLVLNSVARNEVVRAVLEDGELFMEAGDLRALGLRWRGDETSGLVRLGGLPGLSVSYDMALQRLTLTAPADMLGFPVQSIRPEETPRAMVDPATLAPGAILNYDWYALRQDDGELTGSVFGGLRVFGFTRRGVLDQTVISSRSRQPGEDEWRHLRLDTAWRFDDPDAMTSFTLGDGVSGALSWTRATRIGGLHFARNFGLQPYRIVTPLAAFEGMVTLPSTVDLYVNGIKRLSQPVAPGSFQIDRVPTINGAGMAQLLITDITGNSRRIEIPLYGGQNLMQKGLSDWSVDLGQVRRNYGTESFDYAEGLASSVTFRHGYTSALTLEGHAESHEDMINFGAGAGFVLGQWGQVHLSAALSRFDVSDRQFSASYQWSSPRWYASASAQKRTQGYEDIGSLNDSIASIAQSTLAAGFNWRGQSFGASMVRQEDAWGEKTSYGMLNWSMPVAGNSSLNVSLTEDFGQDGGTSLYASLYVPLGGRIATSTSVQSNDAGMSLTASANRSAPVVEGGWGWRVSGTHGGDARESGAAAEVSNLNRYGQWQLMVSELDGQQYQSASGSGSLVLMAKQVYARRRVDDAFAVVSSNGLPNVEVMRQNQVIGQTDENGWLFVDRLHGYQRNLLSMSPLSLPADWVGRNVSIEAVPPAGQGIIVRFDVERVLGVEVPLRDPTGAPLPVGSAVWLDAKSGRTLGELKDQAVAGYVGFDGLLYLENPEPQAHLYVRLTNSRNRVSLCTAKLPPLGDQPRGPILLSPLTCR